MISLTRVVLPLPLPPGQDDQLARPKCQVDGPEPKACFVVTLTIGERHAFEANRVAQYKRLGRRRAVVAVVLRALRAWGSVPESVASDTCARPRTGTHVKMMSSGVIR